MRRLKARKVIEAGFVLADVSFCAPPEELTASGSARVASLAKAWNRHHDLTPPIRQLVELEYLSTLASTSKGIPAT